VLFGREALLTSERIYGVKLSALCRCHIGQFAAMGPPLSEEIASSRPLSLRRNDH